MVIPFVVAVLAGTCTILILVLLKIKFGFFKTNQCYFGEPEAKMGENLVDEDLENLINDVFNDVPMNRRNK
ncbi:MAG: hypothetical protein V3V74_07220 [Nitrosomonadaceae bacterium]